MLGVIIYILIAHICMVVWISQHKELLDNSGPDVVRRYIISITIGPLVVIPFWIILYIDSIIIKRGQRLIEESNKYKEDMLNEYKILGDKIDVMKHYNIINDTIKKQNKFTDKTNRYMAVVNKYAFSLAKWLGIYYI
jgi:predicted PurR-regulated permease PerM